MIGLGCGGNKKKLLIKITFSLLKSYEPLIIRDRIASLFYCANAVFISLKEKRRKKDSWEILPLHFSFSSSFS
jgi:hypothetical protein